MLIAITGGIGCGKSVVSQLLRVMGYAVYDCDSRAKELMVTDEILKKELIENFGKYTYLPDGSLNKTYLSKRIFGNTDLLEKMNEIIHPAVARDLLQFKQNNSKCNNSIPSNSNKNTLIFFESAILYESKFDKRIHIDKIISVSASIELRILRTMVRDKAIREQVLKRIYSQMSQEEKDQKSDFVIINDDKHSIIKQIESLLQSIS